MAVKRLIPLIEHQDLGYVQLWQDELGLIVKLMRQLDEAEIYIETNESTLDDIPNDLPKLKVKRLSYFKVIASTAESTSNGEIRRKVMEVSLAPERSYIEAVEPDDKTYGIYNRIIDHLDCCRRVGPWLGNVAAQGGREVSARILTYSLLLPIIIVVMSGIIATLANHFTETVFLSVLSIAVVIGVAMLPFGIRCQTVLYSGTRAEAPTWWQAHRSDVYINVINTVLSLIIGVLLGHYWHS